MDTNGAKSKAKISGYLEKKSKMRMVSSWKRQWFVLEDRLLLFYRSKDDYDAISPCKGSINLGPLCTIKSYPSVKFAFQIVTRTTSFTLRAENSIEQKNWMQTIMYVLNQDHPVALRDTTRLSHFRYSLDDLVPENELYDSPIRPNRHSISSMCVNKDDVGDNRLTSRLLNEKPRPLHKINSFPPADDAILRAKREDSIYHVYERISGDSVPEIDATTRQPPLESNIYAVPFANRQKVRSLMIDNENYSVPMRKSTSLGQDESELRNSTCDVIENAFYAQSAPGREEMTRNPLYFATGNNSKKRISGCNHYESLDDLYEDLDKSLNVKQVRNDIGKKSDGLDKPRKNSLVDEKGGKVKKSASFLTRLWRKRYSASNKGESSEKNVEDRDRVGQDEEIYAEVDTKSLDKVVCNDAMAIQMLAELHSLMEIKKPLVQNAILSMESEKAPENNKVDERKREKQELFEKLAPVVASLKNRQLETLKITDLEKNNNVEAVPTKVKNTPTGTLTSLDSNVEQARSLDEILQDLESEKVKSNKIKTLIEKYDSISDSNVELRKKPNNIDLQFQLINKNKNSDDLNLNQLLDELAKITSAPVLPRGETCSLINPIVYDEQLMSLLEKRQKRLSYSEPIYDVPRLLKPEPNETQLNKCEYVSMTPDSLEIESSNSPKSYISHHYYHQNNDYYSLNSQPAYINNNNNDIIYSVPKSYVSVATHIINTCPNICGAKMTDENTVVYKSVKNVQCDEIFPDSLEINEAATKF